MGVKENSSRPSRAGAPALEKGLDLLEALADAPEGVPQKAIAERVGRSVGEIFRMLGVLERRGYVARDPQTGSYALTLRLFELAHRHPPMHRLQRAAIDAMQRLADSVGHSCHLAALHAERLMVVAEAQPDRLAMGWTVRLGAVFPLSDRFVSARVMAAFQSHERRAELVRIMAAQDGALPADELHALLRSIARRGHDKAPSRIARGVTDISCPIFDPFGQAVAALTVPHMAREGEPPADSSLVTEVKQTAAWISAAIGGAPEGAS